MVQTQDKEQIEAGAQSRRKVSVQAPSKSGVLPWSDGKIRLWTGAIFMFLFLATFLTIAPQIQQRLDQETRQRLELAGIDASTLDLDWDYRNLTVMGHLPERVSAEQLAVILRGSTHQASSMFAKGIRHLRFDLDDALPIAAARSNPLLSEDALAVELNSDGRVATLSGIVQTETQRSSLVKAMLSAGVDNIFDQLDVASVAETAAANERVTLLAQMLKELGPVQTRRSEIKLSHDDLFYRIIARDKHSALAIEKAAAANITDFSVTGGVDVLSTNQLEFKAESDGEKITLSGKVFSSAQRNRLVFAASEAVGARNVVNHLDLEKAKVGSTEMTGQIESVASVVSRFAPGVNGDVTLKNGELIVNAIVGSSAVREYLIAPVLAARRSGMVVEDDVNLQLALDESEALQAELNELVDEVRETVVFATGASVLSPRAMQTLDKIAGQISAYDDLLIEIEGHTDDVGRAGVNEQLSQSRANAVRNYLAQTSIDGSRLIAVGYGHRRPIKSNDTAEGRQANRRVHFTVLRRPNDASG